MTSNADDADGTPTVADLAPLSRIRLCLHIDMLVGFREECDEQNSSFDALAQRPALPDACPPLMVLPLRTRPDEFDAFLADVIACAMGRDYATSRYMLSIKSRNVAELTIQRAKAGPFPFVQCESSSIAPLVSRFYQDAPASLLQPWKWTVEYAAAASVKSLAPPAADGPAHPLNTYAFRPYVLKSPLFVVDSIFAPFEADVDDGDTYKDMLCGPLARIRSSLLTQLNPSCRLRMLLEFGDLAVPDDEMQMLVALKRLATMLWVGGEECLRRALVHADRKRSLCLLTESSTLRVHPLNPYTTSILMQGVDVNPRAGVHTDYPRPGSGRLARGPRDLGNVKFYNDHAAGDFGPAPDPDHLRRRVHLRDRAERDLLLAQQGTGIDQTQTQTQTEPRRVRLDDPARVRAYAQHGLAIDRILADEIYMIWRASSVQKLAGLLSLHFHDDGSMENATAAASATATDTFAATFDFTPLRARRRKKDKAYGSVVVNLFPCSLDPGLVLAWSRVCAALAHRAAYPMPEQDIMDCVADMDAMASAAEQQVNTAGVAVEEADEMEDQDERMSAATSYEYIVDTPETYMLGDMLTEPDNGQQFLIDPATTASTSDGLLASLDTPATVDWGSSLIKTSLSADEGPNAAPSKDGMQTLDDEDDSPIADDLVSPNTAMADNAAVSDILFAIASNDLNNDLLGGDAAFLGDLFHDMSVPGTGTTDIVSFVGDSGKVPVLDAATTNNVSGDTVVLDPAIPDDFYFGEMPVIDTTLDDIFVFSGVPVPDANATQDIFGAMSVSDATIQDDATHDTSSETPVLAPTMEDDFAGEMPIPDGAASDDPFGDLLLLATATGGDATAADKAPVAGIDASTPGTEVWSNYSCSTVAGDDDAVEINDPSYPVDIWTTVSYGTAYFKWLGMSATETMILNNFTSQGRINRADIPDEDGVLRSLINKY